MAADTIVPPDVIALIGTLMISIISGFVSIAQRIARGHEASLLWVTSEFMSAILTGWIAYDAYPKIVKYLPDWWTHWMFVAFCAHFAGRIVQTIEDLVYSKTGLQILFGNPENKPPDKKKK